MTSRGEMVLRVEGMLSEENRVRKGQDGHRVGFRVSFVLSGRQLAHSLGTPKRTLSLTKSQLTLNTLNF